MIIRPCPSLIYLFIPDPRILNKLVFTLKKRDGDYFPLIRLSTLDW